MQEPLTEDLLMQLLDALSVGEFFDEVDTSTQSMTEYLNCLLEEKALSRPEVVRMAGLNPTYGYQIFMGERKPSRDKLLALGFAMGLSLKQFNRLLRLGGVNELYCKNRRDAIIIFCLTHEYDLQKTEEELYRFGEETISAG